MIFRQPHPTISLTPIELSEAVQLYVLQKGMPTGKRIGNLVATELSPLVSVTGANRLCGQLTFELLPESEK